MGHAPFKDLRCYQCTSLPKFMASFKLVYTVREFRGDYWECFTLLILSHLAYLCDRVLIFPCILSHYQWTVNESILAICKWWRKPKHPAKTTAYHFLTCLGQDGERQITVSGDALDHKAIRVDLSNNCRDYSK